MHWPHSTTIARAASLASLLLGGVWASSMPVIDAVVSPRGVEVDAEAAKEIASIRTANTARLVTWWHGDAEVNTQSPVEDANVRKSGLYSVQVAAAAAAARGHDAHSTRYDAAFYDSFVYNVIPANGMQDQLQYARDFGQDQSWTSFLYSTDVVVKISRSTNKTGPVVIRPTRLKFPIVDDGESIFITVPYSDSGYRFSVEFADNLIALPPSNASEPLNALLIFACPHEDASMVPRSGPSVVHPAPGRVTGLNTTKASTVYFEPGVYYFTGQDHMRLSPTVNWVYFAPGSYVKGAVEFLTTASEVKVTGHGVLSGEQYVWYADPSMGYQKPDDANNNGLRMWSGNNGENKQLFTLKGVTICAPPFNSMDWKGNVDLVTCHVNDYKQVGSFSAQTDGIELYAGSVLQGVFYHANDDTIKMYYSNVLARDLVLWKLGVGPDVQFGWAPRNTENVTIDSVDVIHQAYDNAASNPGLFGSDNNYNYSPNGLPTPTRTADTTKLTRNITWSNFRSEGPSACLFRIYALQNLEDISIENIWIEEWEPAELDTTESRLPPFYDVETGAQVRISNFSISGFFVGDTAVNASNALSVGQINVDPSYEDAIVWL